MGGVFRSPRGNFNEVSQPISEKKTRYIIGGELLLYHLLSVGDKIFWIFPKH
jgi:hypothetical protein